MSKNKKNQQNYFTRNIRENGENFIYKKSPKDISRDASTIFRDIARGKVDMTLYYTYFTDAKFIGNLLEVAHKNMIEYYICSQSIGLNIQFNQQSFDISNPIYEIHKKYNQLYNAYSIIYSILLEVFNNNNINMLLVLPNRLYEYRYIL